MADVIEAPIRELRVVRTATGEVVHRVNITFQTDRFVERCLRGLLTNMNREEFHVEDSRDQA